MQDFEVHAQLLRNLVLYIEYLRFVRLSETAQSMVRGLVTTYERELVDLEMNELSDALCAVSVYARHAYGVTLPGSVLEEIDVISSSRELFASTVINDTVSYIILNSFVNDYLAFAVSRYSPSVAAAGGSTSAGDDPTSTSDFSWAGDSTSAADSTSPVV